MVRLSELAVHHGVEHGVDAAVEPGQVCTQHVQHLRRAAAPVRYVEQQEWDEAEDEAEEHGEAHAGHAFELTVLRWASGGGGRCRGSVGHRDSRGRCSGAGRRDNIRRGFFGSVQLQSPVPVILTHTGVLTRCLIRLAAGVGAASVGDAALYAAVVRPRAYKSGFLPGGSTAEPVASQCLRRSVDTLVNEQVEHADTAQTDKEVGEE